MPSAPHRSETSPPGRRADHSTDSPAGSADCTEPFADAPDRPVRLSWLGAPGPALQFVMFSAIGVLNTVIDYAVYALLIWTGAVHYLLAATLGYGVGLINSFVLNRLLTFRLPAGMQRHRSEWARFLVVNVVSLGLNLGVLYLLVTFAHFDRYLARIVAIAASLAVNFAGNKLWTFRYRPADDSSSDPSPTVQQERP
ncbi:MAG: GtrA family protein [Phycisphaerae bacterium]